MKKYYKINIFYFIIYMKTLVLGRNNIVDSSNSRFEYKFNPNIQIKDNSIALSSLIIPYSW